MKAYAIFDLDGTLLDSMEVWNNLGKDFLKKYNLDPPGNIEEILKTMSLQQSAEYFIREFHINSHPSKIIIELCQMIENNYKFKVQLKPFVLEYLQHLKYDGVQMCIATALEYDCVATALKRLKVYDFFEFILTCSDAQTGKEDPQLFNLAAQRLGVKPKETVVFEDALHAIKSAKTAGCYVVGVYDKSAEADTQEIKKFCDRYITSFREMRPNIENGVEHSRL